MNKPEAYSKACDIMEKIQDVAHEEFLQLMSEALMEAAGPRASDHTEDDIEKAAQEYSFGDEKVAQAFFVGAKWMQALALNTPQDLKDKK